jgi:hypothetical protein
MDRKRTLEIENAGKESIIHKESLRDIYPGKRSKFPRTTRSCLIESHKASEFNYHPMTWSGIVEMAFWMESVQMGRAWIRRPWYIGILLYCYIGILLYCYVGILLYCYVGMMLYCYIVMSVYWYTVILVYSKIKHQGNHRRWSSMASSRANIPHTHPNWSYMERCDRNPTACDSENASVVFSKTGSWLHSLRKRSFRIHIWRRHYQTNARLSMHQSGWADCMAGLCRFLRSTQAPAF